MGSLESFMKFESALDVWELDEASMFGKFDGV